MTSNSLFINTKRMCELDHEYGALKFQVLQPASQTQGIYPGSRQQCQINLIIFLEQRF